MRFEYSTTYTVQFRIVYTSPKQTTNNRTYSPQLIFIWSAKTSHKANQSATNEIYFLWILCRLINAQLNEPFLWMIRTRIIERITIDKVDIVRHLLDTYRHEVHKNIVKSKQWYTDVIERCIYFDICYVRITQRIHRVDYGW